MTSNTYISDKKSVVSTGGAVFRTLKCIFQPLLIFIAIFTGGISFFEPQDGTNSRLVMRLVCLGVLLLLAGLKLIDKYLANRSEAYRIYTPRVQREYNPGSMFIMILVTLVVLLPIYIIIITSLKTPQEANNIDFTWYITQGVSLDAYQELFRYGDLSGIYMSRALLNSLALAIFPTLISLLVSAASAFMFVQGYFRNKKGLFQGLIYTMLMPGCVTTATAVLMWDNLNLMGTPVPLFAGCFFGAAGTVMFLREYMSSLANELFESAEIDGAGRIRQYFNIVLPVCKPILVGRFILGFIGGFNDYMGPLIYIHDPQWYTVQIALDFLRTGALDNTIVASGCVFVTVPLVVLYLIFHKQILTGVHMSHGLKA